MSDKSPSLILTRPSVRFSLPVARWLATLLFSCWLATVPAAVHLAKDLNPQESSSPTYFTVFNNRLYFNADDGVHGRELWVYDGNKISLVADLNPQGSSNPFDFIVFRNQLYFIADDGSHGRELWSYDGNQARLVSDINPQTDSFHVYLGNFTIFNDRLYFNIDDGVHGDELWSYDGNQARLVADINPTGSSFISSVTVFKQWLYFMADDGKHGKELWSYDGQQAKLVVDLNPNGGADALEFPNFMSASSFIIFRDQLYFVADDGKHGKELWVYNGNRASLVADINPKGSSYPAFLTVFKDQLYFSADDGSHGNELWVYDGRKASLAMDLHPTQGSNPQKFTLFNDKLYFSADDGKRGYELWVYDGHQGNLVADINPAGSSEPTYLTVFDKKLLFRADDGTHGNELWAYENGRVSLVKDLAANGSSYLSSFTVFNHQLYFVADDGVRGRELWTYTAPEISVEANFTPIEAGATTPFGSVYLGRSVDNTFTIKNLGINDLNLSSSSDKINLLGNCAAFRVTAQPQTPVGVGQSSDFTVQFTPVNAGQVTCTVSIANDDNNENPYEFNILGTGEMPPQVALSVLKKGDGTVSGSGVACGTACTKSYEIDAQVTLTATPAGGQEFAEWSGACSGPTPICQVNLASAQTVTATFKPLQLWPLVVNLSGPGKGSVTGDGINCSTDCKEDYLPNTQVTLTATPAKGQAFIGWSGACIGSELTCQVKMSQAQSVTAIFSLLWELSVTKAGSGEGRVTSEGIDCGTDCNEKYFPNTQVTLTASALEDSSFNGWGGSCTGTSPTTTVIMAAMKTCSATFDRLPPTQGIFTLNRNGNGTVSAKRVASSKLEMRCLPTNCNKVSQAFDLGTQLTLTALPKDGSTFVEWSDGCSGTATELTVTLTADTVCTANFTLIPMEELPSDMYRLTILAMGTGYGEVKASDGGIQCGEVCENNYFKDQRVRLKASPDALSTFKQWSGCSETKQRSIEITITSYTTCMAEFESNLEKFSEEQVNDFCEDAYLANNEEPTETLFPCMQNRERLKEAFWLAAPAQMTAEANLHLTARWPKQFNTIPWYAAQSLGRYTKNIQLVSNQQGEYLEIQVLLLNNEGVEEKVGILSYYGGKAPINNGKWGYIPIFYPSVVIHR